MIVTVGSEFAEDSSVRAVGAEDSVLLVEDVDIIVTCAFITFPCCIINPWPVAQQSRLSL